MIRRLVAKSGFYIGEFEISGSLYGEIADQLHDLGDNTEAQQSYLLAGLSYLEGKNYTQAEKMFASAISASEGEQSERAKVLECMLL